MFCKTVLFFDKVTSFEKITLTEKDEIGNDSNTAYTLNTFFSNIASNLKISAHTKCDPLSENISNPVCSGNIETILAYLN